MIQPPKFIEELNARLAEVLAQSPAKDIEKNMRATMTAFFSRLDLVTREDFDVQAKVLERTRESLRDLQARLEALEQKLPK
jgi:ubiquinone biosynthesis accessory factor UbiK